MSVKRVAIFASGRGSNAEQVIQHFQSHPSIAVSLVLSNRPQAYVLARAQRWGIPTHVFNKQQFFESDEVVLMLQQSGIDALVLAGFLWRLPKKFVEAFPQRIINLHPSLLPKYGGKGMYGQHVHRAVLAHEERETGITIHLVDEIYDHGEILRQEKCSVTPTDTSASVAQKVQQLEHQYFPQTIEAYLTENR